MTSGVRPARPDTGSRYTWPVDECAPHTDPIGHGIDGVVLDEHGIQDGFGSSENHDPNRFVSYRDLGDEPSPEQAAQETAELEAAMDAYFDRMHGIDTENCCGVDERYKNTAEADDAYSR